ncbi:MAG: T9SS type A sorting domain-containing protein [Fibrobacter sp.]|nr:T9SS type A sorting domain-containing protein [Fibrobacter sp.]
MVTLSWDMLNQPSWADEVTLNKKNVTKFTWEVKGDMKGTQPKKNFLSVDDVRCVGWSTKPFVPSSSSVARSSSSIVPSSSSVTPSSSSIAPSSSSIAFSSSSVQQSSSSIVRSSSSSVILSSSSSAKSSSSVAPSSSSVIPSSSSVAPSSSSVAPSSSSVAPVEYKIIGNLEQSVAKGAEIDLITVTGVKSFTRDSYMAYFLDAVVSNGTLTIFGKVPEYFYLEGLVTEKFTVNGERIELKLTVLALVSSSSEEPPQSSSSEETVTSSSSVLPESSSSAEEPPMCMPVATLDKLGFSYARNTLSILGVRGTISIQVFDLMGHFVKEFVANSLLGEVQFDLNVLPKGNYLVRYTANAVAKTARIAVR